MPGGLKQGEERKQNIPPRFMRSSKPQDFAEDNSPKKTVVPIFIATTLERII